MNYPDPLVGIDTEPYEKQALDDVVDSILLWGQYPHGTKLGNHRPVFDLREWVNENIDPADLALFYIQQITDYSNEADVRRMDEAAKVEKALREELRDSQIVTDRAIELAEEEKDSPTVTSKQIKHWHLQFNRMVKLL